MGGHQLNEMFMDRERHQPKLHTSIVYAEAAYEMWENSHKRYSMANAPKIHQLKSQLCILQTRLA